MCNQGIAKTDTAGHKEHISLVDGPFSYEHSSVYTGCTRAYNQLRLAQSYSKMSQREKQCPID